jgi:hypothetical protein
MLRRTIFFFNHEDVLARESCIIVVLSFVFLLDPLPGVVGGGRLRADEVGVVFTWPATTGGARGSSVNRFSSCLIESRRCLCPRVVPGRSGGTIRGWTRESCM